MGGEAEKIETQKASSSRQKRCESTKLNLLIARVDISRLSPPFTDQKIVVQIELSKANKARIYGGKKL